MQLDFGFVLFAMTTKQILAHSPVSTFQINLLCVNPAERLQECCTQGISTIFFSATLLPIRYYKELLGQGEESKAIYAASPFDPKNRLIVTAADVSSKYTRIRKIYRKYLIKVWIIIFYDKYHTFSLPINIL